MMSKVSNNTYEKKDTETIQVSKLFNENSYVIPIYQRNYAWEADQIEQLIDDIDSAVNPQDKTLHYFLGSLVVNILEPGTYEVIDGQQRLTTLYLLKAYLGCEFNAKALRFSARKKSNQALDYVYSKSQSQQSQELSNSDLYSEEIINGFKIIEQYFKTGSVASSNATQEIGGSDENEKLKEIKGNFAEKLDNVNIIRVQVPRNIDLNHYFEIMNTRGEQLEPHEIAKAKILSIMDNDDKKAAALIWDACSNMDSYVQMNFKPDKRNILFPDKWGSLKDDIDSFDALVSILFPKPDKRKSSVGLSDNAGKNGSENSSQDDSTIEAKDVSNDDIDSSDVLKHALSNSTDNDSTDNDSANNDSANNNGSKNSSQDCITIKDVLEGNDTSDNNPIDSASGVRDTFDEDSTYESIMTFANFLLQVNAVQNALANNNSSSNKDDDATLDDKAFFATLKKRWENAANAKEFLFKLLQCRVLFDKYIIKREKDKDWSLMRLEKSDSEARNSASPTYLNTFEKSLQNKNQQILTLEACLRITYTSPKTMHWVTHLLTMLLNSPSSPTPANIIEELENYCGEQLNRHLPGVANNSVSGFAIPRIVFTYLDYILYRDEYPLPSENGKEKDGQWKIQFRNSIEHFYPQHPSRPDPWKSDVLNCFGNLALLTVSANSKFSNNAPAAKVIENEDIFQQSIKLQIMRAIVKQNQDKAQPWTPDNAREHGKEMIGILKDEIQRLCPKQNTAPVASNNAPLGSPMSTQAL